MEQSNKIIRTVIAKIMYPIFKSKHAHVSFAERPFRNSPNEPMLFKWIFFYEFPLKWDLCLLFCLPTKYSMFNTNMVLSTARLG